MTRFTGLLPCHLSVHCKINTQLTLFTLEQYSELLKGVFPKSTIIELNSADLYLDNSRSQQVLRKCRGEKLDFSLRLEPENNIIFDCMQLQMDCRCHIGIARSQFPHLNIVHQISDDTSLYKCNEYLLDTLKIDGNNITRKINLSAPAMYLDEVKTELNKVLKTTSPFTLILGITGSKSSEAIILKQLHNKNSIIASMAFMDYEPVDTRSIPENIPIFTDLSMGKFIALVQMAEEITGVQSPLLHLCYQMGKKVTCLEEVPRYSRNE